jgi:hypothetical protein
MELGHCCLHETISKMQAEGERSGALSEPCLMKCIGDALEPILVSLASSLQSHGEARQKQQAKLLLLEEKKLVLRREKIQLRCRHASRF